MASLLDFIGTWRAARFAPLSNHTFTWTASGESLQGEWIIEGASRPDRLKAVTKTFQIEIGEPRLDDGRLLFLVGIGDTLSPFLTEFRLVGADEAVLGAAADKLPAEFAGPEHERSIEHQRVRLQRQR
jgi:hypothetical protein